MDVLYGESELASIRAAAAAGCRLDGRGLQDLLTFEVQPEAASQAAGSVRLRMGDADVLVGVKVRGGSLCFTTAWDRRHANWRTRVRQRLAVRWAASARVGHHAVAR